MSICRTTVVASLMLAVLISLTSLLSGAGADHPLGAPVALTPAAPTGTVAPAWHQADVDRLFARRAKLIAGAVVVGVIGPHHRQTFGYGQVAGQKAGGDTVFETASLSKVFSGLLMAQMIADGSVSKQEAVDAVIGRKMPHFGKQPITLYQLATHTSGLPAWPDNRLLSSSAYSPATMQSYLSGYKLAAAPGSTMIYSNVGYALLGDALAHRAGQPSYEQLLIARICKPLSMDSTRVIPSADMKTRLAPGHCRRCATQSSAPTAGGGADGIRSTVNDLLKLLAAYVGQTRVNFAEALALSCKPCQPVDSSDDSAFGWYVDKHTGMVWKSGRLSGYRTFAAFLPQRHTGVVVLASATEFPSPELGKQLLLKL